MSQDTIPSEENCKIILDSLVLILKQGDSSINEISKLGNPSEVGFAVKAITRSTLELHVTILEIEGSYPNLKGYVQNSLSNK